MKMRKTVLIKETVLADERGHSSDPIVRITAAAVIANPFAGSDVEDLSELFDIGARLGELLAKQALQALGGAAVSYGKAALVGSDGVSEHGAALLHPRFGKPVREAIGGGQSLMPSNVKVGSLGTAIDIPLGHKDQAWSFNHIDTMTVTLADAPRADEIVVLLSLSDGIRVRARVGAGPAT